VATRRSKPPGYEVRKSYTATGGFAAVANGEGDHLVALATQRNPDPHCITFAQYKGPEFIKLKDGLFGNQCSTGTSVSARGGRSRAFFGPLGYGVAGNPEGTCDPTQARALLNGSQDFLTS
jgi:hypothetical protein